jgi:hypothetical protein
MQNMLAKTDTNRETHCEALKEMQAKMKGKMESKSSEWRRTENPIGKK